MGIHCLCPNGHHLNLKKELANHVGVCPHCRARFRIPAVDEAMNSNAGKAGSNKSSSPNPRGQNGTPSDFAADVDNTLDDPNVVWSIRALNGQVYGPAVGSIVKTWIEERRIAPQMLVWREGWKEWKEAEKVFPEIRAVFETNKDADAQDEPNAENLLRSSVARLVDSRALNRADLALRKKKAANSYRLILVLIGLIAVLLIALIVILFIH